MADVGEYPDADARAAAGEPTPAGREPLSRTRVVTAALDFIDEYGLPGLTMRRLGESLGVEAMALYRHVPSREDLLDAVVEQLTGEVDRNPEVVLSPENGWQDFLQRLAHGIRQAALTHPKVFPLVASRPVAAPWLRPPLRSLQWVERFLDGLMSEGFSEDEAIYAYRAFTSFLLGHLLLEVSVRGADVGPLDVVDEDDHPGQLAGFPTVRRLRSSLAEDHTAVEFEDALEDLLHRVALIRSAKTPDGR